MEEEKIKDLKEGTVIILKQILRIYRALPKETLTFIFLAFLSFLCLVQFIG